MNCNPDCVKPTGRAEHCNVCHQTFVGTTAGDKHRAGKHGVRNGPDRRRCLTEAEMLAGEGKRTPMWRDTRAKWHASTEQDGRWKTSPRESDGLAADTSILRGSHD